MDIGHIVWEPWVGREKNDNFAMKPLDGAAVASLTEEIGFELPGDYFEFVASHGGTVPTPSTVAKEGFRESFGTLFFIELDPASVWFRHPANVRHKVWDMRHGTLADWTGFVPKRNHLVPIAGDSGVGYYCFDFEPDPSNPTVLFLDSARNYPDEDGWDACVFEIAQSFSELLSLIGEH